MNPYKDKDLRAIIESIPPEEVARINRKELEQEAEDYRRFRASLAEGKCVFCNHPMDSFEPDKPCLHWFTYPVGIRKKYFEKYLSEPLSYYQLESYCRWMASSEKLIGNVNDSEIGLSKSSLHELTIKYRNIEWSFSVGHTDVEGHEGRHLGARPHYHLQMTVDGRPFINFGDFHIYFTDFDLYFIELSRQAPDKVERIHKHGIGTSVLHNPDTIERLTKVLDKVDKDGTGLFRRQSIISPADGKTISGGMIAEAVEESKRTGELVQKIMERKLKGQAEIVSMVSLRDDPPEIKKRTGKK